MNCQHSCAHCGYIFEHTGAPCGLGYGERLCSSCLNRGWQMAECPRCKGLVPIHDSKWGCDDCVSVKEHVA